MKYQVEVVQTGMLMENCVLVKCNITNDGFIFDPGADGDKIIKKITQMGMNPVMIVNTHSHYDHIGAVEELKKHYKIPFAIHKDEEEYLAEPAKNYSAAYGLNITAKAEKLLNEGDLLKCGEVEFRVIHTPGHTLGGACFYTDMLLVSGDTLFAGSIGRADLYGGNENTLVKVIKEKLMVLPDDCIVISGHGEASTIGNEKRNNPYL